MSTTCVSCVCVLCFFFFLLVLSVLSRGQSSQSGKKSKSLCYFIWSCFLLLMLRLRLLWGQPHARLFPAPLTFSICCSYGILLLAPARRVVFISAVPARHEIPHPCFFRSQHNLQSSKLLNYACVLVHLNFRSPTLRVWQQPSWGERKKNALFFFFSVLANKSFSLLNWTSLGRRGLLLSWYRVPASVFACGNLQKRPNASFFNLRTRGGVIDTFVKKKKKTYKCVCINYIIFVYKCT